MSNILPKYAFLPWLRQGMGNLINTADNFGDQTPTSLERVTIELKVNIKGNDNVVSTQDTEVKLIGPGDIIGINPNAVIKTEPLNWITNFEPNYFPYIEFYNEDFPWRYTPASATSHKLRPWFTLVVLKEDEFTKLTPMDGSTLSSIEVPGALDQLPFPIYNETWAWSHVHVNGDLYNGTDPFNPSDQAQVDQGLERMALLVAENPDIAISRMICPRKLESNTDYHAFLIPAFETGRMAGLGIAASEIALIDSQLPSWGITTGIHDSTHKPNQWPVYHEWYFKSGAAGDFEYLVRQIIPRELDSRVGKRPMDVQEAGYGLQHSEQTLFGALELEGALRIPGSTSEPFPWATSEPAATSFRAGLEALVNLGNISIENTMVTNVTPGSFYESLGAEIGGSLTDDPIIAPPLYGRWHALTKTVDATGTGWVDELNIDPRNRVVAGIGTKIVQENQDQLMDQAWGQVGEIIEANKKLKHAQVSKGVSSAMFDRHIKSQPKEEKLQLVSKMHKKIAATGGGTIFKQNKDAILPVAVESQAFRKMRRANSPLMKRIDPNKEIATSTGSDHITARMSDATTPLQAADEKVIAVQATQTTTTSFENVISYASVLSTTSYNFTMSNPGSSYSSGTNNSIAQTFQTAIQVFENHFDALNWQAPAASPAFDLQVASDDIDMNADPRKTIAKRAYHSQQLQFSESVNLPAPEQIVPILAAPSFKQPVYEAVRDISTELLIPNLNLIPQNTISLLETNPKFIESLMVGLNHEMGRELLWREYPTDQRGTYFKHFWDATDFVDTTLALTRKQFEDKTGDITPIHTWSNSSTLGTHHNRSNDGGVTPEANLVLTIRGDLLKKYPGAVIYAQEAEWQLKDDGTGSMVHDYSKPRRLKSGTEIFPIFGAKVEPEITFIGFDLNACDVRGDEILDENAAHNSYAPGYFFVIKERPGEVRFGVDIEDTSATPPAFATWNDLRWDHVTTENNHVKLTGGTVAPTDGKIPAATGVDVSWDATSTSADLAMATFQNPMMVAIHAKEMLTDALLNAICP